jgi:hypothetical protein
MLYCSLPVTGQSLRPISGNRADVFQFLGVIEHAKQPEPAAYSQSEKPANSCQFLADFA